MAGTECGWCHGRGRVSVTLLTGNSLTPGESFRATDDCPFCGTVK